MVVDVGEEVEGLVFVVVVDSSRQPHHPGVLHVVVLVGLFVLVVVVVTLLLLEVVGSEPLLSKYFQLKQSMHSSSAIQGGRSSYTSNTSWTTERIR